MTLLHVFVLMLDTEVETWEIQNRKRRGHENRETQAYIPQQKHQASECVDWELAESDA